MAIIIILLLTIVLLPFSILSLFFGFSLKTFFASIAMFVTAIFTVYMIFWALDFLDDPNVTWPIRLWKKCFWTQVNFITSSVDVTDLHTWLNKNCSGKWSCEVHHTCKVIQFSRKADAVYVKLALF